jgi:hypothetical protein
MRNIAPFWLIAFAVSIFVAVGDGKHFVLFAQEGADSVEKTETSNLAKAIEEHFKKLDSNKLSERDQAEARIIEMGPKIIDLLPPVSDENSEELRIRIERIRTLLEKEEKVLLTSPSLVNLKGNMSGRLQP